MCTPCYSVFISHLAPGTTQNELKQLFAQSGVVKDVFVNHATNKDLQWTYGFVRFAKLEEALKAVKEVNGWRFKDHTLVVELAKAISKSAMNTDHAERISLPSVDPSIPITTKYSDSDNMLDKVVNQSRLQDMACMLNFEANSAKDTIYINRMMDVIEKLKYSLKIPAPLKLTQTAEKPLIDSRKEQTSHLTQSAIDEFHQKYKDVSDIVKNLIGNTSSAKANHNKPSPPDKSKTDKSPEQKSQPSTPSSPNTLLPNKTTKNKNRRKSKKKSQEAAVENCIVKKNVSVANVNIQSNSASSPSEICDRNGNLTAFASTPNRTDCTSQSADNRRNFYEVPSDTRVKPLSTGNSSLTSSKLFQMAVGHQKPLDSSSSNSVKDKNQNFIDPRKPQHVHSSSVEDSVFHKRSKNLVASHEEPWEEESGKDTQRKHSSNWASELFLQILSDASDSCVSTDDTASPPSDQSSRNSCITNSLLFSSLKDNNSHMCRRPENYLVEI